jgi:hypothetical protein
MDPSLPPAPAGTDATHRPAHVPEDWEECLRMAELLGRPQDRTLAIAELLFSVRRSVRSFENLDLDGVEPAVTFSAAWD